MMTLEQLTEECKKRGNRLIVSLQDEEFLFSFEKDEVESNNLCLCVYDQDNICIFKTYDRYFIRYVYTRVMHFLDNKFPLRLLADTLALTEALFSNDYDMYSDLYKDKHGVRPRFSREEWSREYYAMCSSVYQNIADYFLNHKDIFMLHME